MTEPPAGPHTPSPPPAPRKALTSPHLPPDLPHPDSPPSGPRPGGFGGWLRPANVGPYRWFSNGAYVVAVKLPAAGTPAANSTQTFELR